MQNRKEQSIHQKMAELRLICDHNIQIHQQKVASTGDSFRRTLQSINLRSEENARNQATLGKLKDNLRQLEDELVKVLSVKTRKEAKRITITESLSAAKARTKELKKIVQDQFARSDEYSTIISQQLLALAGLEKKSNQDASHLEDLEEAISWYNKVLGFRIETGQGVKFVFDNIDVKNPVKECSFTIRHGDDAYTLLSCEPYLEDTKELMQELNRTNGLFKFVRTMRERFCVAASNGISHPPPSPQPESPAVTVSAPTPVSASRSESATKQKEYPFESQVEFDRPLKKVNHGHGHKQATASPKSASSVLRSPHFKVRK